MSVDSEGQAELEKTRQKSADEDPMLQAYGRYWLPHVERIAVALEKIAHLDEGIGERLILRETALDALRRIADSMELQVGCMMQLLVGEQKERWLETHKNCTEAQLKEAMDFYESVAIRASGLKYDKK